jgi:hypothetical protein
MSAFGGKADIGLPSRQAESGPFQIPSLGGYDARVLSLGVAMRRRDFVTLLDDVLY